MISKEAYHQNQDSRPALFLGQLDQCLFEGNTNGYLRAAHSPKNIEHLIPKLAIREHKKIFEGFKTRPENAICLCKHCHYKRDHHQTSGKMLIYRRFGLNGLLIDVALYPRASDQKLFLMQYHQWRGLFTLVEKNIDSSIKAEKIPPHYLSCYSKTRDTVGYFLYQWERGNFDVKVSALDLLQKP